MSGRICKELKETRRPVRYTAEIRLGLSPLYLIYDSDVSEYCLRMAHSNGTYVLSGCDTLREWCQRIVVLCDEIEAVNARDQHNG